ncbi:hypothetical protein CAP31_11065 [Sulfuriferula sp. AH1]|nr:hypothetical protein CAP31_11065 [Sulfuriferula sp. AH1]
MITLKSLIDLLMMNGVFIIIIIVFLPLYPGAGLAIISHAAFLFLFTALLLCNRIFITLERMISCCDENPADWQNIILRLYES